MPNILQHYKNSQNYYSLLCQLFLLHCLSVPDQNHEALFQDVLQEIQLCLAGKVKLMQNETKWGN